jgi:Rrf2 family protein
MKLITRDTDYAIRALCFIIKCKKKIVSVSDLVRELNVPRPFLRKILQILNKEGLLKSYKGRGGGFELLLSPRKIFLINLIKIFQGPLKLNECFFKKAPCPNTKHCRLKKKIDKIQRYVTSELKYISLSSLLEKGDRL